MRPPSTFLACGSSAWRSAAPLMRGPAVSCRPTSRSSSMRACWPNATRSTARGTASSATSRPAARANPEVIASLRCAAAPVPGVAPSASEAAKTRGTEPAGRCLTDAQIDTMKTLRDGLRLPYPLAYGVTGYPGYNVFEGTDLSGILGLGASPVLSAQPTFAANGYLFAQGDGYLKYFVERDPSASGIGFDPGRPGPYAQRLVELSASVGAMNPDLSAFIAHARQADHRARPCRRSHQPEPDHRVLPGARRTLWPAGRRRVHASLYGARLPARQRGLHSVMGCARCARPMGIARHRARDAGRNRSRARDERAFAAPCAGFPRFRAISGAAM